MNTAQNFYIGDNAAASGAEEWARELSSSSRSLPSATVSHTPEPYVTPENQSKISLGTSKNESGGDGPRSAVDGYQDAFPTLAGIAKRMQPARVPELLHSSGPAAVAGSSGVLHTRTGAPAHNHP